MERNFLTDKDFNLAIYAELTAAAVDVFNNYIICAPGQYSAADIAKELYIYTEKQRVTVIDKFTGLSREVEKEVIKERGFKPGKFQFKEGYNANDDRREIVVNSFSCVVTGFSVFDVLKRAAAAWNVPTSKKAVFIRETETAATVATVDSPAAATIKQLKNSTAADQLRPVMSYIFADIRRRCLVASDGNIMTVAAAPSLQVAATVANDDTKEGFLISPALLKNKTVLTIDANDMTSNGAAADKLGAGRFPNWYAVLNGDYYEAAAVSFGQHWPEIKKVAAAFAKFTDLENKPVVIYGESYTNKLVLTAENYDGDTRRETIVLDDNFNFTFAFAVNGATLAKIERAEKMYISDACHAVVFTAPAVVSLIMPVLIPDNSFNDTPAAARAFVAPHDGARAAVLSIVDLGPAPAIVANDDTANDDTAAPAADIETSETPAAVPSIESTTANDDTANDGAPAVLVPADIETPAAVLSPVAFVDVCETAANDDTAAPGFAAAPVPVAAPLHFWSPANDDTRRPAVVLDIETGDTPANDDTDAHGKINAVFRYLLRAAAVPEAAAAPVCLPVPVSAVYPLHAVYIDNVLHGVYFSKLLADAVFWNAFFAGRAVYELEINSNETAPAVETGAIIKRMKQNGATDEEINSYKKKLAVSVAAGRLTAADVPAEIAAAVSAFACIPEIPETAAAVPEETNDAPAVCVSLPQDEETPAALIVCPDDETDAPQDETTARPSWERNSRARFARRRARFAPWLIRAAAVAALIVCAAVASWERPAPVAAAPDVPAVAADSLTAFASAFVADSVPAAAPQDEETNDAPAVNVAKETPAAAKKRPRNARKRAAAVAVADSVPAAVAVAADSLTAFASAFVADSIETAPAVPADSVPAVAVADSIETAAPVAAVPEETDAPQLGTPQDEETDAPAVAVPVDEETTNDDAPDAPQDETDDDAPAVPAANGAPAGNAPAPAVPVAASGTPAVFGAVTAAPVWIITL